MEPHVTVRDLTMAFGERVIQEHLSFDVRRAEIFVIMGDSGCGKSTLMRHMTGLEQPASGQVSYEGHAFWPGTESERERTLREVGILFQAGALWTSMTLEENVRLPLEEHLRLPLGEARALARLKLALVGLSGFEDHYPSEISGGMKKRAGLARAIALDPEILYFDEPTAGLDPLSSRRLDDLILRLRDSLGATIVLVTHELASITELGDHAVFLDAERRTMTAEGHPRDLADAPDPKVREFMRRGRL